MTTHNNSSMVALYKATNMLNEDFYIGVTSQRLSCRKNHHLFYARNGSENRFHRSIRKYGEDNFCFEVLWYCLDRQSALDEERRAIQILQPKYNLTKGGDGCYLRGESPLKGRARPKDLVERIAAKLKGKKINLTDDQRDFRRQQAANMRQKRAALCRPQSQKQKDSIRKLCLERAKSVLCIMDGRTFRSTKEAANHYGIDSRAIWEVCAGKRKSTKGLIFKYKDQS